MTEWGQQWKSRNVCYTVDKMPRHLSYVRSCKLFQTE